MAEHFLKMYFFLRFQITQTIVQNCRPFFFVFSKMYFFLVLKILGKKVSTQKFTERIKTDH